MHHDVDIIELASAALAMACRVFASGIRNQMDMKFMSTEVIQMASQGWVKMEKKHRLHACKTT